MTEENSSRELNDKDPYLPKSRGRCFDIGIWGGCGVSCEAFADGECEVPEAITRDEVEGEYSEEDANIIFKHYKCYHKTSEE